MLADQELASAELATTGLALPELIITELAIDSVVGQFKELLISKLFVYLAVVVAEQLY